MTEPCWLKHNMFYRALLLVRLQCAINTDFDEIGNMCMKIKQERCLVTYKQTDKKTHFLPINFFCYVLVFDGINWNIIALVLMPKKV